MKLFKIVVALVLVGLLPQAAFADNRNTTKKILDNGLTVLVSEMPSSPVVSVYGLVKTGAATEGKFLGTGISHFLEHMLFKGTHGREVGELAGRIQAVGGSINAATGMDYTIYTITVPHESFDVALDILSDMLMNAVIDPAEVEKERDVIFGEMRMREDNPDRKLSELVFQNVYINHPYRHPIIGYRHLLAKVTTEDLAEYYSEKYIPNNIIVSVAGNARINEVLPKIESTFKNFERGRSIFRNLPVEPDQITGRHYEEEYPTDLTRLSLSFSGIRLLHPDLYALDALAGIMGIGRSSRLYREVFESKALVHHISASNYTPIDKGLFGIDCLLDPEKTETTVNAIWETIEQIKDKGVSKEELDKIKKQIRSGHVLANQTSANINRGLAIDEAFAGDYQFSEKYLDAIDRVTLEDIKRVANQYLIKSAATTVILKPLGAQNNEERHKNNNTASQVHKHILKNGLTVLLKEDDAIPVVSFRISVGGGVRQEGAALNGLSKLVSATWIKGTARRDTEALADYTEGLGMQLQSFSGRNSFGLELEFLSELLPEATNLVKEIVLTPSFETNEIEKARTQMKAFIRQRNDSIFRVSSQAMKETLFQAHPFRLEQEGTLETVEAIRPEDVREFYKKFAVGPNMVLSVFGDIDAEATLKSIEKAFGSLNNKSVELKLHSESPPEQTRERNVAMAKQQAMVMLGFQGAPLNSPDYYGLELMTGILGSSFNGRIFLNIRDQLGQAYTLGGQYVPGPDMGIIYFYVQTTEEEAGKVKELLIKEIERIQSEPVPEKELNEIKSYLSGDYEASLETVSSMSFTASLDELYGLGFSRYKDYGKNIHAVTQQDVQRLAQQYLDLNKMAVVITLPEK